VAASVTRLEQIKSVVQLRQGVQVTDKLQEVFRSKFAEGSLPKAGVVTDATDAADVLMLPLPPLLLLKRRLWKVLLGRREAEAEVQVLVAEVQVLVW
jgi:hypothetical protein